MRTRCGVRATRQLIASALSRIATLGGNGGVLEGNEASNEVNWRGKQRSARCRVAGKAKVSACLAKFGESVLQKHGKVREFSGNTVITDDC